MIISKSLCGTFQISHSRFYSLLEVLFQFRYCYRRQPLTAGQLTKDLEQSPCVRAAGVLRYL